jgi:hypothetical protein
MVESVTAKARRFMYWVSVFLRFAIQFLNRNIAQDGSRIVIGSAVEENGSQWTELKRSAGRDSNDNAKLIFARGTQ